MRVIDTDATAENIKKMFKDGPYKIGYLCYYLGVTNVAVHKWTSGQTIPQIDRLFLIADLFHCKIEDIVITKEIADKSLEDGKYKEARNECTCSL